MIMMMYIYDVVSRNCCTTVVYIEEKFCNCKDKYNYLVLIFHILFLTAPRFQAVVLTTLCVLLAV